MIKNYLLTFFSLVLLIPLAAQENPCPQTDLPFIANSTMLTVWDGTEYKPFFIKGMNLGVAVPGTSPGELAATTEDYLRWFKDIREAGFNCIRTYTLHYPRFYDALHQYNTANPNSPLHVMIGIWLEEELPGYEQDLFTLSDTFDLNARLAIDAVHGNANIPARFGKAFGNYTTNISQWVMAYIMGREVYPDEIRKSNLNNPGQTSYQGVYLTVANAEPATRWVAERMDKALQYEQAAYNTQRPISFSSWPTLDPVDHLYIPNVSYPDEDSASIDLTKINHAAAPAGIFASFHAYPYYPPFVSKTPDYQDAADQYGPNSYLGYIQELRDYHAGMPVVIAEFGTPNSWGSASFAHSGMDHGGLTELQVGQNAMRMFENMESSGMPGGCYFSWIDEWFKRTWIVDKYDFPLEGRQRWHNIMSAEQNFGLVEYYQTSVQTEPFAFLGVTSPVSDIEMDAGYAYLYADLNLNQTFTETDTMWIGIDTYSANIGERILPNGQTVDNRAEFALMITKNSAKLYVTLAYDPYGIYFGFENKAIYKPGQLYRSVVSNGGEWNIISWRNDELDTTAVQMVGELAVNSPGEILNCITLTDDLVSIKLPWNLLNFTDPSQMEVLHDDIDTQGPEAIETRASDGVALSIFYKGEKMEPASRFTWEKWNTVGIDVAERKKESYIYVKNNLGSIPNPVVGNCDFYTTSVNTDLVVSAANGVLANDFAIDPATLSAQIVNPPANGSLTFFANGGFNYNPNDTFAGVDVFTYRLIGPAVSKIVEANIFVSEGIINPPGPGPGPVDTTVTESEEILLVYPNPGNQTVRLMTDRTLEYVEIRDNVGKIVLSFEGDPEDNPLDISDIEEGHYWLIAYSDRLEIISRKLTIAHN